jgi:hypothetical protein
MTFNSRGQQPWEPRRQPYGGPWPPPQQPAQPPGKRHARSLLLWLAVGLLAGTCAAVAAYTARPGSPAAPPAATAGAPAGHPACTAYKALGSREWLVIARDPDAHKGECVIVYGTVVQADAMTGPHEVRALVGGVPGDASTGILAYPTNVIIDAGKADLSGLVQGDAFTMRAYVAGAMDYGNTFGGTTGAPRLLADSVTRS